MSKKVLAVLSEFGYWGEELIGPLEALEDGGYEVVIATPKGKRAPALTPSMDPTYIDPPLGKPVTSPEMAAKVTAVENSSRLDNPINISQLLPERPYPSSATFIRDFEEYNNSLDSSMDKILSEYAALLLVGGSGPIVDMVNNQRVHDLILGFYRADLPIAAECYGVACLAFARDYHIRKSILLGKHVTGHPIEYDYKDGTGFMGVDFNMGPPPYPLEFILRDAVGLEGQFHGNVGRQISAIVDYPFITGRSTADSCKTGELLIQALEKGLRRYGW
ncbi:MAG: type 1 glutamine amidotransferase domain-containing protein [Desulfuromonadaceae bacterium]|nr:type 1 glutamine amidotransferase domain-containing protein [Desulfuromonadaceae bacterium]MDD2854707.1 type 1 glutamine amidotransferase domain-containing protein [Desulfuromonadaceae bacterium]